MIIKPSISFLTKDSDPLLITDVKKILTNLTGNPSYTTPDPELTEVQSALDDFSTSLANAADGGRTLNAIKNGYRLALAGLVRNLILALAVLLLAVTLLILAVIFGWVSRHG